MKRHSDPYSTVAMTIAGADPSARGGDAKGTAEKVVIERLVEGDDERVARAGGGRRDPPRCHRNGLLVGRTTAKGTAVRSAWRSARSANRWPACTPQRDGPPHMFVDGVPRSTRPGVEEEGVARAVLVPEVASDQRNAPAASAPLSSSSFTCARPPSQTWAPKTRCTGEAGFSGSTSEEGDVTPTGEHVQHRGE